MSHATAAESRRPSVMERLLALAAWKTGEGLSRNGGPDPRRLARPHLGDADLEGGITPVGRPERVGRRDVRRRGVAGEDREVLLDGLVRADRLAELPALGRVARGRS